MNLSSIKTNPGIRTASCLFLIWAICASANQENVSFAAAPISASSVPDKKETLKLGMNPSPDPAEKDANSMIYKKKTTEKTEERAAKSSWSIKNKASRKQPPKTRRVFRTDIGFVDIVESPPASYGILSLDDCIKIAMKNHLPLQIAEKSVALAKLRLWEARRNMLPTATIVFEESYGEIYGRKYYGRKQYVEGQQPVFHGGELFFTMKQGETNLEVVKNDYARVKNDLILQVKKAYYTLAKARGNKEMQEDLSAQVGKISDMVTKEHEAKVISRLELLNVNSQAGQVRYQLASAEGDEAVAELILKQAMNIDPKEKIDIKPDMEFKKAVVDFEKTLMIALVNRPEMKINSHMIDYYNYGIRIAKAKGWPKIDILGQWGLSKEEWMSPDAGADIISGTNNDTNRKLEQQFYAGVKASMPFWGSTVEYSWMREQWTPAISAFQGTKAATNNVKFKILDKLDYYSGRQSADIDFDKARQEMTKARQDITLEVREGCFNYEKALIQLDTASNKVKYQETDLEVIRMKRSLDEAQDSNVIESMIKLAQEKFGYLQALADCHISLASLNKAIGVENYFDGDGDKTDKE